MDLIAVTMTKQFRRFLPGENYDVAEPLAKALIKDGFAKLKKEKAPAAPAKKQKEPGPSKTLVTGPKETGKKRTNAKKKAAPKTKKK
jgi:hypothetical protein